jgi:hypothetical protein
VNDPLLDAKLALERELLTPLSHVLMGYVISKQETQTLFGRTAWATQLQDVLLGHYARVVMVVTGRRPKRPQPINEAALSIEHVADLTRRAAHQTRLILASIDREWDRTPETKADTTQSLYSKMLGKAKAVWDKLKAKLPTIISGQTNPPAEDAREREARRLAGNRQIIKWWSSMEDERVRHAHAVAEAQERQIDQAFDVGGERLMFPGDQSLGASLGNVINCRCSARFVAVNDDGTREELASTPRLTPVAPNRGVGRVDHPALITQAVPLRAGMINRVFLSDMLEARITIRDGVIRVNRGGRRLAIGRYTHGMISGARVLDLSLEPHAEGLGIRELIDRSVSLTNRIR